MDLTATRTRRICNLPLLLQVQKLHKNTTWTRRIYNLSLLLQVKKKTCKAYTPLTTNSILRVTDFCSHLLTAACAYFLMLYSGYVAAFIIALIQNELQTKVLYYFSQRTPRLRNESKNL